MKSTSLIRRACLCGLCGLAIGALVASVLALTPLPAGYPGAYDKTISGAQREGRVVVYSATELHAARPLLQDFKALHPGVVVEYHHMSSAEVNRRYLAESVAGTGSADVLWSPAMDLQMKLVNDGHALAYKSPESEHLPPWAVWRHEAYGTTFEPVVFVYNRRLLKPAEVPQTHAGLLRALREQGTLLKGKVATYDIERVGVGFLLATQDSRTTPAFWQLADAMFASGAQVHTTTGMMMERIASGEALLGYNLLGSYVVARAKVDPSIGYVLPSDYTLVMSRILFISKRAKNTNAAKLWLDYILSQRGQRIIANESMLFSLRSDVQGEATASALIKELGDSIKPIAVGPGLLIYLDRTKQVEFMRRWRQSRDAR